MFNRSLILKVSVIFVLGLAVFPVQAQHQAYFPDPDTSIQRRLEDWQDLKFGLLMHWGAYSQWGIVRKLEHLSGRPLLGHRRSKTGRGQQLPRLCNCLQKPSIRVPPSQVYLPLKSNKFFKKHPLEIKFGTIFSYC